MFQKEYLEYKFYQKIEVTEDILRSIQAGLFNDFPNTFLISDYKFTWLFAGGFHLAIHKQKVENVFCCSWNPFAQKTAP